jgi:hypothetical protein
MHPEPRDGPTSPRSPDKKYEVDSKWMGVNGTEQTPIFWDLHCNTFGIVIQDGQRAG